MASHVIHNDMDHPVVLQIEHWADLLYLLPDESVTLAVDLRADQEIEIERLEDGETWLVYVPAETYGIIEGDMRIDHLDYGSNVIGYSRPLHPKSTLKGRLPLRSDGT